MVCDGSTVSGQLQGPPPGSLQNAEVSVIFGTGSTITFTVTGVNPNGTTRLLNAHHESGGTWSPTESGEITLTGQLTDTFSSTATAGSGTAIWHIERKNGTIDFDIECEGGDVTASYTVEKSADPTTYDSVGDVIDYEILVTNTGNVALSGITITDPLTGDESCPASTLAVSASMTCTASYTITQADLDSGSVSNTSSVDSDETDPVDSNEVTVTAEQSPAFTVEKTSVEGTFDEAGDVLNYEILVTNTGNVTLTGLAIDDPLTGDESCSVSSLAPGADTTCTASYTVTQDDVDAGEVENTASVETNEAGTEEDTLVVAADQNPAFTVEKTSIETEFDEVGDVINYEILVTNTGNVTLTGLAIDDPLTGDESCSVSSLAPGADTTCTASYEITQDDLDNGSVSNTASVETNEAGTEEDSHTVFSNPDVAFTVEKSAIETTFDEVGDVINYEILVTNTGTTTLTGISIDDPVTGDESCPDDTLGAGDDMTCTASHTITQEDLDAGEVVNTATVDTDQTGGVPSNEVTVTGEQSPAFTVVKTVDEEAITELTTLTYTITVENTGNTSLTGVEVEDTVTQDASTLATPSASLTSGDTNSNDILDVGETWVYTVTYTVTESDAEDGDDIVNTASITTTEAPDPVEDTATTTLDIEPGIDEDVVRETFMGVTRAFLARRMDRILASEPEGYRIVNRRSPGGGLAPRIGLNDGMGTKSASFSASLKGVRLASAEDSSSGYGGGAGGAGGNADRFDVWLEGEYSGYDDNLARTARDGRFGIVYIGADYRIHERVLAGILASFDWMNETSSVLDSDISGHGFMVGPYVSAALGDDFFFDGRVAWGTSDNTAKIEVLGLPFSGEFDTTRWLMRANVAGVIEKGNLVITPHVAVAYMKEKQKDFTVFDGVNVVAVPGQVVALGRITVGPEFAYTIVGDRGTTFVPFIRIDSLWDFESAGFISLNGVVAAPETIRAAIELGFRVLTRHGISIAFAGKYDGIGASNFQAWSASGYVNFPF